MATVEQMQEALQQQQHELQVLGARIAALETQLQFESARAQQAEQERSALIQTLGAMRANRGDAMVDTKGIAFTLEGGAELGCPAKWERKSRLGNQEWRGVRMFVLEVPSMVSLISAHLISSHLISSHLISSHLISSHLISSHLISSHLIPPSSLPHTTHLNPNTTLTTHNTAVCDCSRVCFQEGALISSRMLEKRALFAQVWTCLDPVARTLSSRRR